MDKIINEPLVYFKNGSKFHSVWNGTDTNVGFAADTKNNAIIFVEDEHKIYTHGQAFGGSTSEGTEYIAGHGIIFGESNYGEPTINVNEDDLNVVKSVTVTPVYNASTPNVEKIANITVGAISKDIYAHINGGSGTPTPSDYDDTDIRNAIDQLTNSIADTNSRLDNIHILNEQDVKDTVNGMFGTWNKFKGTTKFETWGNDPTSDMQQWLRGMGFFTKTDGTWTELVLRVGQIGAQVSNLSEIMNEDGTIDYETLAAKLQLDILDDVNGLKTAVANLNTKWANVDENQEVLEWVISGFRSQANSGGSFAQLYAEKNSQTESAISALETSVSKNTTDIGNITTAHNTLASRVTTNETGIAQVTTEVQAVDGKILSAKTDMTSTIDSKIAGIYTDVDGKLNTAVAGIIATDKDKDISSSIIAKINANENKSQLQLSADQILLNGDTNVTGALDAAVARIGALEAGTIDADYIKSVISTSEMLNIGDNEDSMQISKYGIFFAQDLDELNNSQQPVRNIFGEYSHIGKDHLVFYDGGTANKYGLIIGGNDASRIAMTSDQGASTYIPCHIELSDLVNSSSADIGENNTNIYPSVGNNYASLSVKQGDNIISPTQLFLRTKDDSESKYYLTQISTDVSYIHGDLKITNGYSSNTTGTYRNNSYLQNMNTWGTIESGNITSHGDIEAASLKVTGGTDQQVLLADGTTKNISELGSGGYPESPSVTSLTASQYITALGYRIQNGTSNELLTANGGKIELSSVQRLPEGLISYNPTIPGIEFGESTAKVTFTTNNSYIGINKPIRNTIGTSGVSEFIWQHPDGDENPALSFGLSDSQIPSIAITASGDYDFLTFDANGFIFNGDVTAKTKIKLYNSSNPGKPSTIANDGAYIRLNSGAGIKLGSDTNNATIFCDENGTTLTNNNEDQLFTFVGNVEIQDSLEVVNDVTVDGQTVHSSDRNLKNIISDITLTAQQVADAPAVNFTWKNDENNINHVGSIAQYWQVVMPEVVKETKKGLGLDYSTAALMSSITVAKELMALKEEIAQLKAQINELTSNN